MECSKTQASFEQRACDVHKTYTCSKFAECYTERKLGPREERFGFFFCEGGGVRGGG